MSEVPLHMAAVLEAVKVSLEYLITSRGFSLPLPRLELTPSCSSPLPLLR